MLKALELTCLYPTNLAFIVVFFVTISLACLTCSFEPMPVDLRKSSILEDISESMLSANCLLASKIALFLAIFILADSPAPQADNAISLIGTFKHQLGMSSTVSATFFSIFFICSFRILSFASGDPGLGAQELKATKRKHKSVPKKFFIIFPL